MNYFTAAGTIEGNACGRRRGHFREGHDHANTLHRWPSPPVDEPKRIREADAAAPWAGYTHEPTWHGAFRECRGALPTALELQGWGTRYGSGPAVPTSSQIFQAPVASRFQTVV